MRTATPQAMASWSQAQANPTVIQLPRELAIAGEWRRENLILQRLSGRMEGLASAGSGGYADGAPATYGGGGLGDDKRPSQERSPALGHRSGQEQMACMRLGRETNSVVVSPDGRRAAFGLNDHTVQIWDLVAQVLLVTAKGHRNWVKHVAYSPDGSWLASASADKSVKVWNSSTGHCEATLQGHMLTVSCVAFSDELATRLASCSWDKTVCIWDVEHGSRPIMTLNGHSDWVHSIAWAPGGRWLASCSSDHSVRVWSTSSGAVEQVLVGHLQTVTSVSFARNGIFLASGSLDRNVRVWNLQDGTLSARVQLESEDGSVHCVAFAPDSERIVVGCNDKSVKVWNFQTGDHEAQYNGHEDAVLGVCVSPDGKRIVSCSRDKTARVWSMPGSMRQHSVLPLSTTGVGSRGVGIATNSFQELHDRLRATEDTNQLLRQQLSEAQTEIEEKNRRMARREENVGYQEKQLSDYREMINSLTAEKERLRNSFEEMRRELRSLPFAPAGDGPAIASAARPPSSCSASCSGGLNAISGIGLAGACSGLARAAGAGRRPMSPHIISRGDAGKDIMRIDRPAGGTSGGPEDNQMRSEIPPRRGGWREMAPVSPRGTMHRFTSAPLGNPTGQAQASAYNQPLAVSPAHWRERSPQPSGHESPLYGGPPRGGPPNGSAPHGFSPHGPPWVGVL